jgi:hypothetical protein
MYFGSFMHDSIDNEIFFFFFLIFSDTTKIKRDNIITTIKIKSSTNMNFIEAPILEYIMHSYCQKG